MKNDNVSRQAAIREIKMLYPSMPVLRRSIEKWKETYSQYIECEEVLNHLPSTDRRGEWKEIGTFTNDKEITIHVLNYSECGALHRVRKLWTGEYVNAEYCPHCGADMRGERDEKQGEGRSKQSGGHSRRSADEDVRTALQAPSGGRE